MIYPMSQPDKTQEQIRNRVEPWADSLRAGLYAEHRDADALLSELEALNQPGRRGDPYAFDALMAEIPQRLGCDSQRSRDIAAVMRDREYAAEGSDETRFDECTVRLRQMIWQDLKALYGE